jgi:hypothetical protein
MPNPNGLNGSEPKICTTPSLNINHALMPNLPDPPDEVLRELFIGFSKENGGSGLEWQDQKTRLKQG